MKPNFSQKPRRGLWFFIGFISGVLTLFTVGYFVPDAWLEEDPAYQFYPDWDKNLREFFNNGSV